MSGCARYALNWGAVKMQRCCHLLLIESSHVAASVPRPATDLLLASKRPLDSSGIISSDVLSSPPDCVVPCLPIISGVDNIAIMC